ncbi:efflux transporter outer membrane subunit [Roseateles violae]|uniref:Efflux transporter outer membrane subunit n=1 Tax=Roseateles violae TaxID=3058042 RepID=A0ABT8DSP0_9BURK|nr:efflux transporter outer membrane subunit [Pelomonas sp. PFR6]MDN3921066.1 efflux transporter outer membrane subunit [Pelomonas sp. PFR6]
MDLLRPSLIAAAAVLALAGCALKSPPQRDELARGAAPNRQLPAQWSALASASAGVPAGAVADRWLASFKDAQLQALVQEALAYSPDLAVAAARVEQAAAYQKAAGALLYPQVNLMARGGGQLSGDSSGLQGVGIFANWELDLWGRVRAGAAAAEAQYVATALDAEYARQSLSAQVAKSWFLATEARMQKALAEDSVKASSRVVDLTGDRVRVGVGDEYELRVAQANLQTFRDTVQSLDQAYQQALRALEILVGRYPAAALSVPAELATPPAAPPVGMPSELLERRPDVIAAERRVAAAFYRGEEAKAARLPRISLTAAVSSVSSELFVLKERDNPVWSAGATILAPLFSGGQLQAQVEIRNAEQKQALAEYGRVGARAFGEVENALSAGFSLAARENILKQAVVENQRALELAGIRYRVGSADLRSVLQQNMAVYAAQVALVRVRSEQLLQRVNLYLALGGGFDERAPLTVAGTPDAAKQ